MPDFSKLSRRQKHLNVAIPYRGSTDALHLLIDSTGLKAEGDGEWLAKRHGRSKPRQWRKVHLAIDADTLKIRAIEMTGSRVGEGPILKGLLEQITIDQPIAKVSADGAYDTRNCHEAIAARNVIAVTPSRKKPRPWRDPTLGAAARNDIIRAIRRFGPSIWRHWSRYHRRSLVKT